MTAQQKQVQPFGSDLILTGHVNSLLHRNIERGSVRKMKLVSLSERVAEEEVPVSLYPSLATQDISAPQGQAMALIRGSPGGLSR